MPRGCDNDLHSVSNAFSRGRGRGQHRDLADRNAREEQHLALTTLVLDGFTYAARCLYSPARFVLRCLPPQLRVRHRAPLLGDDGAQPRQPLVQVRRVRVFLWRGHDVDVAYLA
jgi:hypothetical protein